MESSTKSLFLVFHLIMAFIFPEDKNDFRAPNGVTYSPRRG